VCTDDAERITNRLVAARAGTSASMAELPTNPTQILVNLAQPQALETAKRIRLIAYELGLGGAGEAAWVQVQRVGGIHI
jgi:hypothetical protein